MKIEKCKLQIANSKRWRYVNCLTRIIHEKAQPTFRELL